MSIPFLEQEETTEELPLFKEFAWDFMNDKFILENKRLKVLEGLEAIEVWIYKALKTERYKYLAYDSSYGSEHMTFIGHVITPEKKSDLKRFYKEALLINPYIEGLENLEVTVRNDSVTISGDVLTIYGKVELGGLFEG